jgi:hypothetical protein
MRHRRLIAALVVCGAAVLVLAASQADSSSPSQRVSKGCPNDSPAPTSFPRLSGMSWPLRERSRSTTSRVTTKAAAFEEPSSTIRCSKSLSFPPRRHFPDSKPSGDGARVDAATELRAQRGPSSSRIASHRFAAPKMFVL